MDIAYCRWIIDKRMESGYFTMEIFHSDINYVIFSILYEFWHKTKPRTCIAIIALSLHLYIHGNIEELLDWMLMMIHRTKQKVYK